MLRLWTTVQSRFIRDKNGASLVEYALLIALIALAAIVAIKFVGSSVSDEFDKVGSEVAP